MHAVPYFTVVSEIPLNRRQNEEISCDIRACEITNTILGSPAKTKVESKKPYSKYSGPLYYPEPEVPQGANIIPCYCLDAYALKPKTAKPEALNPQLQATSPKP